MRRFLILALLIAATTSAEQFQVDPAHSQVLFKVRHLGISTVTGEFKDFAASFELDPTNLANLKAEADIDAASLDTREADRDTHLKSADFFDVANHPRIRFISRKAEVVSGNKLKLHGDLTIRGVTKPVVLEAEYGGSVKDGRGIERAAFTAETKVPRKDFGVSWSRVLDGGGLVVSDDVVIVLEIEAVKKTGATE